MTFLIRTPEAQRAPRGNRAVDEGCRPSAQGCQGSRPSSAISLTRRRSPLGGLAQMARGEKRVGSPIMVSGEFARAYTAGMHRVGRYVLDRSGKKKTGVRTRQAHVDGLARLRIYMRE